MSKIPASVFMFTVLLGLSSCSSNKQENSKRVQSSSQPQPATFVTIPRFDGTAAFSLLKDQTDFGPRNPNSAGHTKCLEFLLNELTKTADVVNRQQFTYRGYNNELLTLTNIFASFQPTMTDRILLVAHWDTRPRADMESDPAKRKQPILGANDGASGVAVLLEMARLFKQSPPPIGVDILLADGEDYGKEQDLDRFSLGTRHFVDTRNPNYRPRFGILLDMIGDNDLQIPIEQNSLSYAPNVVETIWSAAEKLGVSQFVNSPGEQIFDDHIPLNEGGIPTVDIIDFQYPYWHTLQDTPDKCSAESLEAVGKVMMYVVYTQKAHSF
jgi:glutaminyl-peptide cyclotransferase